MANQYSGSLEHKAKQCFNCSAEELLQQCADEKLTYHDVEKRLGVSSGTIRKWAKRYGLELMPVKQIEIDQEKLAQFRSNSINNYNLLSRRWTSN